MKILEVGFCHSDWKRKFECTECGTMLEVTRGDLFISHVHDIEGRRTEVQCLCCVCGHLITVARDCDCNTESWENIPDFNDWKTAQSLKRSNVLLNYDNQQEEQNGKD